MKKKKKKGLNSEATKIDLSLFSDTGFESQDEYGAPRFPERKNIELPYEKDAEYAFDWEPLYVDEDKKQTNERKGKPKSSLLPHTVIMALAFVAAFAILCSALILSQKEEVFLPEPSPDASAGNNAQSPADTKTIYIKEFNSSDGVLTPQQIYTYHSESVVTVSVSSKTAEGIGSGFIITTSGYIATAQHVIAGMSDISVILKNGEKYKAELVGSDELCDLALLKISADGLKAVEFGSSSSLLVGDELVAIGTPAALEFSGSMTRGDVSFTDRKVYIYDEQNGSLKKKMTLIQTTAALNPGNSGGPVFDAYGKVVGIVTMRLGNDFEGISFVIPSDGASAILRDMMDGIEITSERRAAIASQAARIGIACESYINGNRIGVKITEFTSDEYDAAKKLKKGDVIVSIGKDTVTSAKELSEAIKKYDPNDSVEITVYRADQLLTFVIILGA